MPKLKLVLIFLIASQLFSASSFGQSCQDIFKSEVKPVLSEDVSLKGLKIARDDSPQRVTSKRDPQFREAMKNWLLMLTDTQNSGFNVKELNKDYEFTFGKKLPDGLSIEFEYKGDLRGDNPSYALNKITLVKPNGQKEVLDKNPLPDIGLPQNGLSFLLAQKLQTNHSGEKFGSVKLLDGKDLQEKIEKNEEAKKQLKKADDPIESLKALSSHLAKEDQAKISDLEKSTYDVQVPYRIEGVMLKELLRWATYLPHVDRQDAREYLAADRVELLRWKAGALGSARWVANQTRRLLVREAIRTAITFGIIMHFTGSAHMLPHHLTSAIQQNHQTEAVSTQTPPKIPGITTAQQSASLNSVMNLLEKESAAPGSELFLVKTPITTGGNLSAQTKNSATMILIFPERETVLIMLDPKTNSTPVVFTRTQNEQAYNRVKAALQKLSEADSSKNAS